MCCLQWWTLIIALLTLILAQTSELVTDGAIFRDSTLNIAMENNTLNMPENSVIVGDDAFPLRTNIMKPYSKSQLNNSERIFNYRLSRARRVSENAFGILVWRFRIFSCVYFMLFWQHVVSIIG